MNRFCLFGTVLSLTGWLAACDRCEASALLGARSRCCAPACAPCVQYDVVYETREIQCCRTVCETAFRPCSFTRCRNEYTQEFKLCPDTVCKTIYRNAQKPYTCTEMVPVYSTVEQKVCREVCEPVTEWTTCCVDMGHWERPAAEPGCCAPCPVWVPKIVEKRVPVVHYVRRTVTETCPVQVCKMVPQTVTKFCTYIESVNIKECVMRKIPYIACRAVTETVTKQVPYTVTRLEHYTVRICVPRCVPRPCQSPCAPAATEEAAPYYVPPSFPHHQPGTRTGATEEAAPYYVPPMPQQTDADNRIIEATGRLA